MPDQKITDLTALTGANAATGDLVEVVDISDSTMAASGTNKKMTLANLAAAVAKEGVVATDAIFDAKGDLAVGTGADTAAKLTVGGDGTIPVADSGATTGLRWTFNVVRAAGVSGAFYRPLSAGNGQLAGVTPTKDTMYLYPIHLKKGTLDRIGMRIGTTDATAVMRLGIYADNGSGRPTGSPILDAGTIAMSSGGWVAITISQAVNTDTYWLASVKQTAVGGGVQGNEPSLPGSGPMCEVIDPTVNIQVAIGYQQTGVTGALPSIGSLTAIINFYPAIVRYA